MDRGMVIWLSNRTSKTGWRIQLLNRFILLFGITFLLLLSSAVTADQLVVVKIVVPKAVNDEARELYQQLEKVLPQSPRADLW